MKDSRSITHEELTIVQNQFHVLLVGANEVERSKILEAMKPMHNENSLMVYYDKDQIHTFDIGLMGTVPVVMGHPLSVGDFAIMNLITRACELFDIFQVFSLGVCASLDETIKKGTVLIAKKIIGYESVKLTENGHIPFFRNKTIDRASVYVNQAYHNSISRRMLAIEEKDHAGFEVKQVAFLSGRKLLNQKWFRAGLKAMYPDAIGFEMEGEGLALACQTRNIGWAMVKAVSDYAVRKEGSKFQILAMDNVIRYMKLFFSDYKVTNRVLLENKGTVLISGSYPVDGEKVEFVENFCYELGKQLISKGYIVLSGYGLTVGPALLTGIYSGGVNYSLEISDRVRSYPFPRLQNPTIISDNMRDLQDENRKILVSKADAVIFIFGEKKENNSESFLKATGMISEYREAKRKGAICIPVHTTGGTSIEIYQEMKKDFANDQRLMNLIRQLDGIERTMSLERQIGIILEILESEMDLRNGKVR